MYCKKKHGDKLNLYKKLAEGQLHPPATHECPQKIQPIRSSRLAGYTQHIYESLVLLYRYDQECNARKVNCGRVHSAYILKLGLSGRNL